MTQHISEAFGELGISIGHPQIVKIERMAIHFALRDAHPLTFDGPYIGVDPVAFKTSDYNALFEVFGLHKADVEKKIRSCQAINTSHVVTSDPYNLLCVWLCHLAPIYIKDKRVCHNFQTNVLRLYHYKVFCSSANHMFFYGANRGVMEATVASLTKKSDIVRFESWKLLIESHIEAMLDPKDRVYPYILEAAPDDMFLRVISDSQTKLRAKIVTFANSYYDTHKAGESVKSMSSVSENAEGEKIIAQTASVIESVKAAMIAELLNINMFINDVDIEALTKDSSTLKPHLLRTALQRINETAILQTSSRKFDKIETKKGEVTYIGLRALLVEILRTMLALCRTRKVSLGSKVQVYTTMTDAFRSSRNSDKDIIAIKRSVAHLVDGFNLSTNEATRSAIRLGVINYILYRTIQKM